MKKTYLIFSLAVVLTLSIFSTSQAVVVYQDLGTGAPPTTMGGYTLMTFSTAAQAAITNGTAVTTIPGSPIFGDLTLNTALTKGNVGITWATWSHGYSGPVFTSETGTVSRRLTLPPFTGAFYFYIEPRAFGLHNITAVTNSGVSTGPIQVEGNSGARGFGFYTTEDNEYIAYIDINADAGASGFSIAEFGIAEAPFMCVGQVCYYNCITGSCPASHCDVYIPGAGQAPIMVGQITYLWLGCAPGACPPSACSVYIPVLGP
jgi:hypothetical protein